MSPAERIEIIDELTAVRVSLIRVPLSPSNGTLDAVMDLIRRAARRKIATLLVIWPAYDPAIKPRPPAKGTAAGWDQPGLSAARAGLLRVLLRPLLAKIDDEGIILAGLEYANEINWTPFNGDFPLPGQNVLLRRGDLRKTAEGRLIAKGFDTIVANLKVLRALRAGLHGNAHVPIILGGMADTARLNPSTPPHLDAVTPSAAISYLREEGVDSEVDAYGVHAYFSFRETPDQLRVHLAELFSFCASVGSSSGKPCWLTEWGISVASDHCRLGENDRERSEFTKQLLLEFREYIAERRLTGMMYYDWSGPGHGIFRCGVLSDTGRHVLSGR